MDAPLSVPRLFWAGAVVGTICLVALLVLPQVAAIPVYLLAPACVAGLALVAGAAHLLIGAGRHPPRPIAFARSFAVVNLAFATGWINVLRGRGIEVWHRAEFRVEG